MEFNPVIKRMSETYELNIEKIAEVLKNIGINIIDSQGKYKLFNEVIEEIASKWDHFNGDDDKFIKEYILRIMVGIRDKNYLRTIIEKFNKK